MRIPVTRGWRQLAAAVAVAAGLTLAGMVSPPHAMAADSSITGVVEDASGAPQANVTVNALDPGTGATDASTATASDGTFSVAVDAGTYNVQFVPPSGSGLQTYLVPDVNSGAAPLTIVLTTAPANPATIQVTGVLSDSSGGVPANSFGL